MLYAAGLRSRLEGHESDDLLRPFRHAFPASIAEL
jgi:hypothetical protein